MKKTQERSRQKKTNFISAKCSHHAKHWTLKLNSCFLSNFYYLLAARAAYGECKKYCQLHYLHVYSFNKCKCYLSSRSHGAIFKCFCGLIFSLPSIKCAKILQSGGDRGRIHLCSFVPTAVFAVWCVLFISVFIFFPLFSDLKQNRKKRQINFF